MIMFNNIKWENDSVVLIDQKMLPWKEIYHTYTNYRDIINALSDRTIDGNTSVGIAAAMGAALAVTHQKAEDNLEEYKSNLIKILNIFMKTRPSHRSLEFAVSTMKKIVENGTDQKGIRYSIRSESKRIFSLDMDLNKRISENGSGFINENDNILLYSNYGRLSAAGYGTALGMVRKAKSEGKNFKVIVAETRPVMQGARLTAWELYREGFDVTVVTDNAVPGILRRGEVTSVITGAESIASNGDCLSTIGTSCIAECASRSGIPFYVGVASDFNFSMELADGRGFNIEKRPVGEVAYIADRIVVPEGVKILNPVFDVTSAEFITAIISDKGVEKNVKENGLSNLK